MNIAFIRHGKTMGNKEKRYVGSINLPVCDEGLEEIKTLKAQEIYPKVQHVYVSPMLRCLQTLELVYPKMPYTVVQSLHEQDFGAFENKTYAELAKTKPFRDWLDSAGEGSPPDGETKADFDRRCNEALAFVVEDALKNGYSDIAVLCHGGVMMGMFTRFAKPKRGFYDWLCGNGRGYIFSADYINGKTTLTLLRGIDCEEER